jgi:hypothetical protein
VDSGVLHAVDVTVPLTSFKSDGRRYSAFATDTPVGVAHLDARHRAHARVEDRIRCGRTPAWTIFPADPSRSTPPG